MSTPKVPGTENVVAPVSVVMSVKGTAAAVSAISRLRTMEDSVQIAVRGERSAVLRVLSAVAPEERVADSVQVALTASKSAVLNVLQGLRPGAQAVSAIISLRGGKPVGGG
jgi:hypothetical protein